MAIKVRATMHNGRTRSTGEVYRVNHNDRNYDTTRADNINPHPERRNRYFIMGTDGTINCNPAISFEQHEQRVYTELFGESLAAQNLRHIQAGHRERVRSVEEYRLSPRTCPEETVLQLGTRDEYADPTAFQMAVNLWCNRMHQAYGSSWRLLDGSIHFDEATPHAHIRAVWVASGKDGFEVSQNKALQGLGIERPDPSKPKDRHNNPKHTFTELSRQIWLDAARECGIEVEETPKLPGKRTQTKEEFVSQKIRTEVARLTAEREELQAQAQALKQEANRLKGLLKALGDLLRPLQRLAEKLSRLRCVDGKSALEHCREELAELDNLER